MDMKAIKKIKTINSYDGMARFLAECDEKSLSVPKIDGLPKDKFSYSPDSIVEYWNNIPFVRVEVSHRKYEIWQVA